MRGAAVALARALAPWYGPIDGWLSGWIGRRNLLMFVAHFDEPGSEDTRRAIELPLARIRETCHMLPLPQAMDLMARGELPDRPAVLFIDDATRAFHETGYPILREHGIPFALAVLPGLVPDDDRVHALSVVMRVASRNRETPLAELAAAVHRVTGAHVELGSYAAYFRFAHELDLQRLRDLREVLRLPDEGFMSWADLDAARRDGGVELVNHSMSHPMMKHVADEWLDFEIRDSRARIQERLGVVTRDFVFPYGTRENATPAVVAALASSGYRAAYLVGMGVASRGSFLQPRAPLEARPPLHLLVASHALNTLASMMRVSP